MSFECSICLSGFKVPVCLPCGHLYCQGCIVEHVNSPTNRHLASTCPECRTAFQIAIPDLTYLPKKYHPFITPAIRRVFIDVSAHTSLQKRLQHAERRLDSRKRTEEALLDRCEGLRAALDAHRAGEAEANESLQEMREKSDEVEEDHRDEVNGLQSRIAQLEKENTKLTSKCKKLTIEKKWSEARANRDSRVDVAQYEASALDDSNYSFAPSDIYTPSPVRLPSIFSTSRTERRIKPLPKRSVSAKDDMLDVSGSKRPRH